MNDYILGAGMGALAGITSVSFLVLALGIERSVAMYLVAGVVFCMFIWVWRRK